MVLVVDNLDNILFMLILLNLITQAMLMAANYIKISFDEPVLFKLIAYALIHSCTSIFAYIILYIGRNDMVENILSYFVTTTVLVAGHFVLDEDFLFRFEKYNNFFIMAPVSIAAITIFWFFFVV